MATYRKVRSAVTEKLTGSFLPLGVPTRYRVEDERNAAKERIDDSRAAAAFRVRVALPGEFGETLTARVESLRAEPQPAQAGAEDLGKMAGLKGGPGWPDPYVYVTLRRLGSAESVETGAGQALYRGEQGRLSGIYNLYESKDVVVLVADPRAKTGYERQKLPDQGPGEDTKEDEESQCRRCARPKPVETLIGAGLLSSGDVKEMLASGEHIRVVLGVSPDGNPADPNGRTNNALNYFRNNGRNYPMPWGMAKSLAVADAISSVMQISGKEPELNGAVWDTGQRGLAVSLPGGEALVTGRDHLTRGRAVDVRVERHHRSGALGFGPLGPGWSSPLFSHIRRIQADVCKV